MSEKIGVYICSGCGIGSALDIEKLQKVANEYKPAVCNVHPFLCSEEGVKIIKEDINSGNVDTVVIAGCSMRVNTDQFAFDPLKYVTERVNLREHVVWSHASNDEGTQMIAEDQLRMGIIRAQKAIPPVPHTVDVERCLLIVGGGIAGITAAIEATKTGYQAIIVEKSNELGGRIKNMQKLLPSKPPYSDLEISDIKRQIEKVENNPDIKVYKDSNIKRIEGEPGNFDVTLDADGKEEKFKVGAIVFAIGWKPYDRSKLPKKYNYDKFTDVITNVEFENMAKNEKILRKSDGKTPSTVVFLQCVAQRDKEHLPYCSSVCCMTSLKEAKLIREANPDAQVYILYQYMRTPGLYENFYKSVQDDDGIALIKADFIGLNDDGKSINVEFDNKLIGEKMVIKADLVVLATGMVTNMVTEEKQPNSLTDEMIGHIDVRDADGQKIEELIPEPIALNLKYRQGPELPHLKYGFPDSHFICFPYETRRTGIYAAGAVRAPMNAAEAARDAAGAVLKAIQSIELSSQGKSVHPRSGDQTFPDIRFETCTQCRRCTVECPFGMYDEDEKGTPKINITRCRRCGTCMGACPQKIITFSDYSPDMISSMLREIQVPEDEDYPIAIGFICENDAYPAFDMAGINRLKLSPHFRFIRVRCLGSVNIVWVSDALSKGIDGVLLLGCPYGDDYQCHNIKGSQLAHERIGKVGETLDRLSLEHERVGQVELSINDYDKLPQILDDFIDKLKEMGPNPFKGF